MKPTELIGRTETKQVWAVLEAPDVTYFHDDEDEDHADPDFSTQDAARDYATHTGGILLLLTVESRITAVEQPEGEDA